MTTSELGHLETRLHQLEREVLKEQRFMHDFIERANLMVIGLDRQQRVTIFNRRAESATGFSKEDVIGSTLDEAFPSDAGNTVRALGDNLKLSGGSGFRCETQLVTKSGESKRIVWNASCLTDADEVVGLMAFGDDTPAPAESNRGEGWFSAIEVLQRFSGKFAHDFNNLLGTVLGYASMLRVSTPKGTSEHEYAEKVESGVRRCAGVMKRLLDFGHSGAPELERFEVGPALQHAIERLRPEAPSGVTVAYTPPDNALRVNADPVQFEQALGEVVRNAFDAMPDGGRVELTVASMHADADFCSQRPGCAQGWFATVQVTDTGPGIPPESAQKFFEPFASTKNEQCAGLGLSTAFSIVRANGGWIELDDTPGEGTTVTLYLPLDPASVGPPAPDSEGRQGPQTVLLVDDEKTLTDTVSEMLKHLGYLVLTAGDGDEAIRIYKEHKANVDLIVLDMIMPRKGGPETYEELKQIQPDVKVLLTSGFEQQHAVAEDMCREGADGFLQKPFRVRDLSNIITQAIKEHS